MNEWNHFRFWLKKITPPHVYPQQTWWDVAAPWIQKVKKFAPFCPDAAFGPDNLNLGFGWDQHIHHLELDIEVGMYNGVDIFYRDRETGKNWLIELQPHQAIPQDVIDIFKTIRESPGEPGKIWFPSPETQSPLPESDPPDQQIP